MISGNLPLHDLISDVGMQSSGDDVDGIDLSSHSTSSAETTAKFVTKSPLNGCSDDSGLLNGWFVSAAEMAILMLRTFFTKNAANVEQNDTLELVDNVTTSRWLVQRRPLTQLTAYHTRRLSLLIAKTIYGRIDEFRKYEKIR